MKNIFQIFELMIGEDNFMHGVQAISLVDEGAIDRDFMHFNKKYEIKLETIDEEKRMVMGPVLVPKKMILRAWEEPGKETEYFYVHFSEETVRKTAQRFMEMGNQKEATFQHEIDLDGVVFVESWVKDFKDDDKSSGYGYGDMPTGTWFAIARIDNDEVWEKVKSGEVKAFSIEGRFADSILEQRKLKDGKDTEVAEIATDDDLALLKRIMELLDSVDENATDE